MQNEKMRAEFEAWAKTDGANGLFDRRYRGWQAAYARGYVAGLKRAAEICETIPPKVDQGTSRWRQSDRLDCAAAIRAEIEE